MQNKISNLLSSFFWAFFAVLLGILCYFIIHNAYWLMGDEAIVYSHTGMGIPFSPLGFENAASDYGRLYPFAYNLYDVLLLFHDGYISPLHHYILHAVALIIMAVFTALTSLHILKGAKSIYRYTTSLCLVAIVIFRVYGEFIQCYTGAWIIFMFLPIFIYSSLRFDETEHWGWGTMALLTLNYICYCYENICTIPFAIGVCGLLFSNKKQSSRKQLFHWLMLGSALLFLSLYAIIVLPQATHFYGHAVEDSILKNAWNMFVACKIYWIALVFLFIRFIDIIKNRSQYVFYDSLLLAAWGYFIGTVLLKLDMTYYYNVGNIIALTAILYYCQYYIKQQYWTLIIIIILMLFYGRRVPKTIKQKQKERTEMRENIINLSSYVGKQKVYYYAPAYPDPIYIWADLRNCKKSSLESLMKWQLQIRDIDIIIKDSFDSSLQGIWLFPNENTKLFSDKNISLYDDSYHLQDLPIFNTGGLKGYLVNVSH